MDPLLIPIAALFVPVVLVPVILGLRHARIERELEHAERIKALELGRTLPRDEPFWSPARISIAIGAGVPIGVFGLALIASQEVGYRDPIWVAAGFVGVAGVLGGTYLAGRFLAPSAQARSTEDGGLVKPFIEDDAFDVVGSRGGLR